MRAQSIAVLGNSREIADGYMRAALRAMRIAVRDYFASALV